MSTSRLEAIIKLSKQLSAELGGTFLYLCLAPLAGTNVEASTVTQALANGLIIASVVQITGPISGGHVNPAVTMGFLCSGYEMTFVKAIAYIIAQIIGSILGALAAYCLTVETNRGNLGATIPYEHLKPEQVLGLELIMTFLLVAVILNVTVFYTSEISTSLAIGLCITACQCSALPYTASLNPVRSFGPALIMNIWTRHWIYWLGPLLGGAIAGSLFRIYKLFNTHTLPLEL